MNFKISEISTEIRIQREALKFSSAHMTVFADGTKEALHGHNYQVAVMLAILPHSVNQTPENALKEMLPFSILKKEIKAICEQWDEKILLPKTSPFLKKIRSVRKENDDFTLCGIFYSLPKEEVQWLDCPTISCETLSENFLRMLVLRLPEKIWTKHRVASLRVEIQESPHQGASSRVDFLASPGKKAKE